MAANLDPQLALDERAVNDPELEAALERHLRAADDVREARGVQKTYRKEVDAALAKHELGADSALRVGRFRITKRAIEARHVEFDSSEGERITIGLVDADGNAVRRSTPRTTGHGVSDNPERVDDLRPATPPNVDALRGDVDRATIAEPTQLRPGGRSAGRNAARGPLPPVN